MRTTSHSAAQKVVNQLWNDILILNINLCLQKILSTPCWLFHQRAVLSHIVKYIAEPHSRVCSAAALLIQFPYITKGTFFFFFPIYPKPYSSHTQFRFHQLRSCGTDHSIHKTKKQHWLVILENRDVSLRTISSIKDWKMGLQVLILILILIIS